MKFFRLACFEHFGPSRVSRLHDTSIIDQLLVDGFNPLKNISQSGSTSQLLGKYKMFQTANQITLHG